VIVLLDASTLINLANGGVLALVLSLDDIDFHVSSFVRDESNSIAELIDQALDSEHLMLARDDLISLSQFSAAKVQMRLGNGETECILIAGALGCSIACDDGRARRIALQALGDDSRVTGSIGLLKIACERGLLTPKQAAEAVEEMQRCGGYLPAADAGFFLPSP
jgi:predicted nucleic acid-binding protein